MKDKMILTRQQQVLSQEWSLVPVTRRPDRPSTLLRREKISICQCESVFYSRAR
eukprot:SAG11_NODE_8477_length_1011_cov_0.771930_1_plen_53_part_10